MMTVSQRIHHKDEDLHDQLIEKMKGKEFCLQLDEAVDSDKDVHLICYVRFLDYIIIENLLFFKSISGSMEDYKSLFAVKHRVHP